MVETRLKKKADKPLVQRADICFNVFGHGFYHKIENRVENQIIMTYGVSSKSYNTRTKELGTNAHSRPSLKATGREKEEAKPPHTIQCVVVGLAPSGIDLEHIGKTPSTFKLRGKAVGTNEPAEKLEYDEKVTPYRVVAEVTNVGPLGTKLYVLMDEERACRTPITSRRKRYFILQNSAI
jgi:hypothetical protein